MHDRKGDATPRTSARPKVESFNFRVDPELKAAFTAATAKEDKPAGQVLREFMRGYVERQQDRAVAAEARRHSRLLAERAADPGSDEATLASVSRALATFLEVG